MNNGKKLRDILLDLRAKGYKILIDDFGTGYNSLMSISEISFDIIKIDKYFIDRLNEVEIKVLVKHIIEFIHEMGGMIIAEGVETKEQFGVLKELGCDMIQGYYFSKPLLPEEFAKYYDAFDMNNYI
ncbi:MAG: EAL domain-containing protein [Clostridium sp.]|nr:EAL domain-containing protein [Clostridium sp.]